MALLFNQSTSHPKEIREHFCAPTATPSLPPHMTYTSSYREMHKSSWPHNCIVMDREGSITDPLQPDFERVLGLLGITCFDTTLRVYKDSIGTLIRDLRGDCKAVLTKEDLQLLKMLADDLFQMGLGLAETCEKRDRDFLAGIRICRDTPGNISSPQTMLHDHDYSSVVIDLSGIGPIIVNQDNCRRIQRFPWFDASEVEDVHIIPRNRGVMLLGSDHYPQSQKASAVIHGSTAQVFPNSAYLERGALRTFCWVFQPTG